LWRVLAPRLFRAHFFPLLPHSSFFPLPRDALLLKIISFLWEVSQRARRSLPTRSQVRGGRLGRLARGVVPLEEPHERPLTSTAVASRRAGDIFGLFFFFRSWPWTAFKETFQAPVQAQQSIDDHGEPKPDREGKKRSRAEGRVHLGFVPRSQDCHLGPPHVLTMS